MGSPEVIQSTTTDRTSDIYSAMAVFAALIRGRSPFEPQSPIRYQNKRAWVAVHRTPQLDGIPENLLPIFEKILSFERAQRYGRVPEILRALDQAVRPVSGLEADYNATAGKGALQPKDR